MSLLNRLKGDEKINLFIGDFIGKKTGYPMRSELCKVLTKEMKDNIKSNIKNQESLLETSQMFLDAVVGSKSSMLNRLREFYEYKKTKNDIYDVLLKPEIISSIFTLNYDTTLEDFYMDKIEQCNPYLNWEKKEKKNNKIELYRMFGDFNNLDKVCVSKQDLKKLKVLPFYKKFWNSLGTRLEEYPTVFLGVNLEDPDFLEMLSYLMENRKMNKMYMVTSMTVLNTEILEKLNRYKIKLLTCNEEEFLNELKSYSSEEEDIEETFIKEEQTAEKKH